MHPQADSSLATGIPPPCCPRSLLIRVHRAPVRAALPEGRLHVCSFSVLSRSPQRLFHTFSQLLEPLPTAPTSGSWRVAGPRSGAERFGSREERSCPSGGSAAQTHPPCSPESCLSSRQSQPLCLSGSSMPSWPPFSLAPAVPSGPSAPWASPCVPCLPSSGPLPEAQALFTLTPVSASTSNMLSSLLFNSGRCISSSCQPVPVGHLSPVASMLPSPTVISLPSSLTYWATPFA